MSLKGGRHSLKYRRKLRARGTKKTNSSVKCCVSGYQSFSKECKCIMSFIIYSILVKKCSQNLNTQ